MFLCLSKEKKNMRHTQYSVYECWDVSYEDSGARCDQLDPIMEHLMSSKEKSTFEIIMVPIIQIGFLVWSLFDSCKTPKRIKVEEQS